MIDFKRKIFIEKRSIKEVLIEIFGDSFSFLWFIPIVPGGFYKYFHKIILRANFSYVLLDETNKENIQDKEEEHKEEEIEKEEELEVVKDIQEAKMEEDERLKEIKYETKQKELNDDEDYNQIEDKSKKNN